MNGDDEVGYKRPPKQSRFKPGRSGNPRGRSKGVKNIGTELAEELGERIVIREGGVPKRVTKQQAIIKRLVEKGLQGDPRILVMLTGSARSPKSGDVPDAPRENDAEDKEIIARFLDRHRKSNPPGSDSGD